jgi:hypothetical protein
MKFHQKFIPEVPERLARLRRGKTLGLLFVLLVAIPVVGCRTLHQQEADLSTPEPAPIYRVEVADGDEAALLRQQLEIKPIRQEGLALFFRATDATLTRLHELGYWPQLADPGSLFFRVVEICRKGSEQKLTESGVTILLRKKKTWVVRGNLTQLRLLKAQRYHVLKLTQEPHPREIEVTVTRREDVQRVSELHVDIYSVAETVPEKQYRIAGGAFDYQIDALRANHFVVNVKPNQD